MLSLGLVSKGCAGRKIHTKAELLTERLVHGNLSALSLRHAEAHRLRNTRQDFRKGMQDIGDIERVEFWQLDTHHQRAGAVGQRSHALASPSPLIDLTLQGPRELAVFGLRRPQSGCSAPRESGLCGLCRCYAVLAFL